MVVTMTRCTNVNRPISQIPQCTCSTFRTEISTYFVLNGALLDIEQAHSEICELGQFWFRVVDVPESRSKRDGPPHTTERARTGQRALRPQPTEATSAVSTQHRICGGSEVTEVPGLQGPGNTSRGQPTHVWCQYDERRTTLQNHNR